MSIHDCHHCPLRQRPCAGACVCTVDGADIRRHADAGYCPHPEGSRFGDGRMPMDWEVRGLGDVVAKITSALHIKPCGGCKKRQKAMNDAVPFGSTASPEQ